MDATPCSTTDAFVVYRVHVREPSSITRPGARVDGACHRAAHRILPEGGTAPSEIRLLDSW